MHIGNYSRKKRKQSGYTQEKLAEKCRVSVKTIQRLEKEEELKQTTAFTKVYNELGILSENEIFTFDYDMNKSHITNILKKLGFDKGEDLVGTLDRKLLKAYDLEQEGDYKGALNIYESFNNIFESEDIFLLCANIYLKLKKYETAIDYCNIILEKNNNNYHALMIKGISLAELKKYKKAKEILKRAENIQETEEVYYNLGVCYHLNGQIKKAIEHYTKCIDLNSNLAEVHLNLGACYLYEILVDDSLKAKENCLKHLKEAIELDPTMYEAYAQMGEYYRINHEFCEAEKCFKKCLELNPDNISALSGMAIILSMKDDNEGIEYLNKVKNICLYNKEIDVDMFIGKHIMSDGKYELAYPIIYTLCESDEYFDSIVKKIKGSVELFNFSNSPIHISEDGEINVNIVEQKDYILIEIICGEYTLRGVANKENGFLNEFMDLFNKHKQFRIQIQGKRKLFIIDLLKNISINLYKENVVN